MGKLRVVHYINQFFGQIGGEDKADIPPMMKEGPAGPGVPLQNALAGEIEIVNTIICGDTYFGENIAAASAQLKTFLQEANPDLLIAGPAFNAGRYGVACGEAAGVAFELGIPTISGMYPENPGYEMYRKYAYMIETTHSAAGMKKAIPSLVKLIKTFIAKNGELGSPAEEGYMPRGIRYNVWMEKRASQRAVDMLIKKVNGEAFETECPMPVFDRVTPSAAVADMTKAKVALVTSGGIIPIGNPDHIESSSASKFGKYDISDVDDLTSDKYYTTHGGYDPVYANADPDCVLPVDMMRELEKEGVIGKLHDYFYATVGTGTSVGNSEKFGKAIAEELLADGVQAVILTST